MHLLSECFLLKSKTRNKNAKKVLVAPGIEPGTFSERFIAIVGYDVLSSLAIELWNSRGLSVQRNVLEVC